MAKKINITIKVTHKEVQMANFCIAQFLNYLQENQKLRKYWNTTTKEILAGERFKKELINKYIKLNENPK